MTDTSVEALIAEAREVLVRGYDDSWSVNRTPQLLHELADALCDLTALYESVRPSVTQLNDIILRQGDRLAAVSAWADELDRRDCVCDAEFLAKLREALK